MGFEAWDNLGMQRYRAVPDQQHRLTPQPGNESTSTHRRGGRLALVVLGVIIGVFVLILLLDPGSSSDESDGAAAAIAATTAITMATQ
jgi:hypothetical protein